MTKVRGSKQYNMVIKHHQPLKRWLIIVAVLFGAVSLAVASFLLGQNVERQTQTLPPDGTQALQQLQEQNSKLEQEWQVDSVALQSTRRALKEKQQEIQQLKKNLAFYKGVMAPEKNAKGLQIDRLGIEKTAHANKFRVKWVLIQAGKNTSYLSGDVTLQLAGKQAGEKKLLLLKDVVSERPKTKFKFRYFQSFSVQVELPKQFVVEQVLLSATSKGAKPQTVKQQYDWVVQEKVVDVE